MKKKNKERKKTEDEIQIISALKAAVNDYSARCNFIRSVEFKEETEGNEFRLIAVLDCGAFEQRIIYYPMMLFTEHFIDTEFLFKNSEYIYTFYDVFNLFDIGDFNLYYYGDLLSVEDVAKAVSDILAATEQYFYYIEKAQTADYLPQLEANYEADMTAASGSDVWKDEEYEPFLPADNHPLLSFADGEVNEKLYKRLKKQAAKNKLDTMYEKRLLKYLENGGNIERKSLSNKKNFEKVYSKKNLLLLAAIFIIFFAVSFGASSIIHSVIFRDAFLCKAEWTLFGIHTTLPFDRITLCILVSVLLTFAFLTLFGKRLIVKIMPDEMKSSAAGKYDSEKKKEGKLSRIGGYVAAVVCVFISLSFFLMSCDDIGFYDDHLVCTSSLFFGDTIQYDELNIYSIAGHDDNGEYVLYENTAYAVASDNGTKYYFIGEVAQNGEMDSKLKEIAQQYSIEIVPLNSDDDFYALIE